MISQIVNQKILPILRGLSEEDAFFLIDAFQEAGLNVFEVSLNQPGSLKLLESINTKFGETVSVGAGTVLTREMAIEAKNSGATFFLSPSISHEVFESASILNIPYIPGALTPSEIQQAHQLGAKLIKVFPIRQLGATYIKDVLASLNHVDLLAVGGVDLHNTKELFQAGVKGVGIGSSLAKKEWISNRDKAQIMRTLELYKNEIQE
ncbi:bifunctional 4-hydroxy-2-oxoglutarate aldolase/2-dehydro-3-deoxy-phosphogluconate aldolase [Planococcus lenghuensis]|uniref:2-dehydro-3-deoxyphosphogluconate aldolase n=1 Tax=Planococcus lenghuensis TaxID=2213202 RepID=A0A1Q2L589_9BACL|nr:bifunctional 4-hydroxy-2-oxoglutarate aldolase/2-dehydro-3-deoxy-phosphogluconate aldolase [Planococcus lenghuensis]AQQ55610.1 hypothetical protein B0X71_20775 [Planococcus lenghuensis]